MKKLMIAAAALMVSVAAYGQGQFIFNNRIGTEVNAKFQLESDAGTTSSLIGNAYTVQLLGGKAGTPVAQLTPLGTTDFRTGAAAGYVNQISPVVAGVAGGQDATILVRVFAGATATGTALKDFGPYTITLTEAPATPPALQLGTTALKVPGVVPEPATLALGALGLGALLMIRRRK
jgi:hypothetical protein